MERRNANVRGFTGREKIYRGVLLREFISGYAYARNGNAHNPTPTRIWIAVLADGTRIGHHRLVREAKAAIDSYMVAGGL